jgi:glucose-6-phosphate dehydrogenase assembly protein OpcA
MPSSPSDFFAGIPIDVDPLLIERELAALWKPASDTDGADDAVIRACVHNLVVCVSEPSRAGPTAAILEDLVRLAPGRTILLSSRHDDSDPKNGAQASPSESEGAEKARLTARISAACHRPPGSRTPICCERITLETSRDGAPLLEGAIAPLLVPDVPVRLWWAGWDLETPGFGPIADLADRVVVDSRTSPARTTLDRLEELLERRGSVEIIDLGWRSTYPWRRSVADIFDDPTARSIAADVRLIDVEYAGAAIGDDEFAVPAGLVAAWIASSLDWGIGSVRRHGPDWHIEAIDPRRNGTRVEIALRSRRDTGLQRFETGEVVAVRFLSGSRSSDPYVAIELDPHAHVARVRFETPRACLLPRVFPMPSLTEVELLAEALEGPSHFGVFREALRGARRIATIAIR